MNELIIFGIIILVVIRIIGLIISLDLYLRKKGTKHLVIAFGWNLFIIAEFFPFFSEMVVSEFVSSLFFLLNGLFLTHGGLMVVWGIYLYFRKIRLRIIGFTSVFLVGITSLIFIFLGANLAINFSLFSSYFIVSLLFIIHFVERKTFIKIIGESLRWYYLTAISFYLFIIFFIFLFTQGYELGLYESEFPVLIIINYTLVISITLLIFALYIQFENSISTSLKDDLKDFYSHDLGNIMQVILSALDYLKMKKDKRTESYNLIELKCKEAANLIREIRNL